jgi:signal transduction histidine kinase/chemotaxis methyl-accepting protein methylase
MQPSLFDQPELLACWKEQLIPSLLATRGDQKRALRIWSVGCQTGDEATALVLTLYALLSNQLAEWQIRMFVTDPDTTALSLARQRVYLDPPRLGTLLQDEVPAFEWASHGYRLLKPLRDLLVFAPHDVLVQPPFSRLDLVVCHHPLASLTFQQQARLLNRFAYALSPSGLLMLVEPATVALPPGCFVCLDPHWQLYRRTQTSVSLSALGWSSSCLPMDTCHPAAHACPSVDNQYLEELQTSMEELQASLEEQEVLYHELEERTQALETAYQELEELSRLKDDFLSLVSHELRTPLTVISALAELLCRRLERPATSPAPSPASQHSLLDGINQIRSQGNRMAALIRDMLDVSRLHADVFALTDRKRFDLAALVRRLADQQRLLTGRAITVELEHAPFVSFGDEGRIEQVVTNLLTNALKYSPAESTITLTLQHQRRASAAEEVLIAVHDQGCGISPEHQAYLFDRFYRVHTKQNKAGGGLGLGLYITAEIVKRHGGRIWVESSPDVGSTFWVALPVDTQVEQAAEPGKKRHASSFHPNSVPAHTTTQGR